jgi:hypothetical protein
LPSRSRCQYRFAAHESDALQIFDGSRVHHVAGVQRRLGLQQQDVRLFLGDRKMLDAARKMVNSPVPRVIFSITLLLK